MGTPLPAQYVKADGSRYLSGTEWEYENAIQASDKGEGPAVLLYRRTEPLLLNPDDPEFESKTNQYRSVKQFFDSLVNADGSIRSGYNSYKTPSDFKEALELHLKSIVERLIRSPKFTPTSSTRTIPAAWPTSPFPGLRAFKPADAPIFFGRERETDALVKRIEENPVVAIVGASGSGKSSLVGAGLIPRLLLTTGNEGWLPITTTPDYLGSGNPFAALAASLLRDIGAIEQPELATALARDNELLVEICRRVLKDRPAQAKLLLFIDQFEELFTTIAPSYRQSYVDTLVKTAASDQIRMVLTLRGDFYGKCVELPQLAKLLEESTYPLSIPGIASLFEMITRPAARADLKFDEGLAQRILDDTGDEPGSLALMAYTLDELYRLSAKSELLLTHGAYEELGGVQGAIGKRSESVFLRLDEKTQAALPHVFRELVEVDERGTATRQRAALARAGKIKETSALITALTDARLLVQSRGENNEPFVEVAHEALLRSWERLAEWIKDTQDDLRLLRQVRIAARDWDENGKRDDFLWSHERLEPVYAMRDRLGVEFDSVVLDFIRPEVERLLDEFKSHHQYFRQRPLIERFIQLGAISVPCAVKTLPYAISKSAKRATYGLLLNYPVETLTALINSSSDQDVKLRRAVTQMLAYEFPIPASDTLKNLVKDEDAHVRCYAVAGLVNSPTDDVTAILENGLRDSAVPVRQISAIGLASLGAPKVVDSLASALEGQDYYLRPLCVYLLGLLGNVTPGKFSFGQWWSSFAIEQLLISLRYSYKLEELYDWIEAALQRADGALVNRIPQVAVDSIIQSLDDKHSGLNIASAEALSMIAQPSIVDPLKKLLIEEDKRVRQAALAGLGNVLHPSVIPVLLDALSSQFVDIRTTTAELLGKLGEKESDPSDRIRGKLRAEIVNAEVTSRLSAILDKDKNAQVRQQIVTSLGHIGGPVALLSLSEAATDEYLEIRVKAVTALGELGDHSAVPILIGSMDDTYVSVKFGALKALQKIGDPRAIPALIDRLALFDSQILHHEENGFRFAILEALGTFKDNSVLPVLKRALADSDYRVQASARRALGRLNTTEARQILKSPPSRALS